MLKRYLLSALLLCCAAAALSWSGTAAHAGAKKIRVVLIDGQNNHKWEATSPFMKKVLEDTGRFSVDVSTFIDPKNKRYEGLKIVNFPPDLSKYDVIVSNYNGNSWPKDFNDQFDEAVKSGKIGLVIVHAANNSFGGWKEYNQMIGLGWRNKKFGDRIKVDESGKEIRVPAGEDLDTGHRYSGPFTIVVRDDSHPVTKGMPREWLHANDELYDNLRGPAQNMHILATAIAPKGKGTGVHEPMIFTISYGKGRVFHTPMGHDLNGMRCVGFVATLLRGTEWAATGSVTLPLPSDFPTPDKISQVK